MKKAVRGILALATTTLLAASTVQAQKDRPTPPREPEQLTKSQIEEDIEKIWGKRRKVAVIQKRLYPKAKRWEISAHFGVIPNDPFVNYLPIGARFTYHFKEWLALEFGGLYSPGFDSSLGEGIKNVGQGTAFTLNLTLLERFVGLVNVNAVFSLLYGKVAFMKTGLSHFDLFLTAGPSLHIVEPPVDQFGQTTGASRFRPGGNLGIGMKFFVNDFFGVRLDVRQYLFPKSSEAGGGLHKPTEITVGATFFAG